MFDRIDFHIHSNHIEICGQSFLLGELTADLLSINAEQFTTMQEIADRIKHLLYDDHSEDRLIALRADIGVLHQMLMQYKLFQVLSARPQMFMDVSEMSEQTLRAIGLEGASIPLQPEKYYRIVDDIHSFNQTMFWFIDKFTMRLKKLDTENYAAALFDFYHHPGLDKMMVNHFRNGASSFTLFDEITVRYEPREIPGSSDNYAIYEVYSAKYLQAFLKIDFMKSLMAGHVIRRCKYCKRFFLLTQGYHTEYCDRPLPDNPKRTCRTQGAKDISKEKAKNNPIIRSYHLAYGRLASDKHNGRITEADWKKATNRIRDLRDMATAGYFSDRELEEKLQPKPLYKSLNITRIGGR